MAPVEREFKAHLPTVLLQLLCSEGFLLCQLKHHSVILLPLQGGVGPWNYHPQEIRAILEKPEQKKKRTSK